MKPVVTLYAEVPGGKIYSVTNLHPKEMGGHLVLVPDAALEDRKAKYGKDDVLDDIIKEHYKRLNGKDLEA